MKSYKAIEHLSVITTLFSYSCSKHVTDSETRKSGYIIIDGEKVEINATTDTLKFINDSSYYKNRTIPRKYIK